ncbi:hypothetical protein SUGI_1158860 [Cryptomeria japonica]|nr:hypothetical protein SUGI_1158860 [Cryptomeria japonica]
MGAAGEYPKIDHQEFRLSNLIKWKILEFESDENGFPQVDQKQTNKVSTDSILETISREQKQDHPLYIQSWSPNFDPSNLVVYEKPVWIRLYSLPIEYWSDACLEKNGKTLGMLIDLDEGVIENDLYTYARMRIVVVKEIPSSVTLLFADGEWTQQIEVGQEFRVCTRCGNKRHMADKCRIFIKKAYHRPPKNISKVWKKKEESSLPKTLLLEGPEPKEVNPINPSSSNSAPQMVDPKNIKPIQDTSVKQEITTHRHNPEIANNTKSVIILDHGSIESTDDMNIDTFLGSSGDAEGEDDLASLDPRCISQSANTILGCSKGTRGRKSNRTVREQRVKEKGIVSVLNYLNNSKGGKPSLGGR